MSLPQGTQTRPPRRKKPVRQKHVPIRTCVSCRETGAKRGLVRIVRSPEGAVAIDPTGKENGRGAYLCHKAGCWDRAVSSPLLSRALNAELAPETIESLKRFAASLHSSPEAQEDAAGPRESAL